MKHPSLFHKDISNPSYLASLAPEERAIVDHFVEAMTTGPADGEMDIDWQGTARGYYVHLEILHSIANAQEQERYRELLREDIETRLQESPDDHMVLTVREQVFGDG
jgi:hypothetical protein